MAGFWQDLRYAVRLLRRTPRNSAIAIAILALGIGANTAMFSAVNHVLLQPLPFPDAGRLWRLRDAVVGADGQLNAFNMRARNLIVLREGQDVFDGMIGFAGTDMTLLGAGAPERLSVVLQTDGNARTLDARPILGRGFSTEEERRGVDSGVAVISDSLWKSHFGGTAAALGATLQLDARTFTVIGVMPPLYAFPYRAEVWVPTTLDPADTSLEFAVFVHLKPGVTPQQVRASLVRVAADVRRRYPDTTPGYTFEDMTLQQNLSNNQTGPLRALATIVTFLLLTACINVATLMLARSVTRRREFAVRAVLGASQMRHIRQLMAEGLVLATIGCGAGILLAEWLGTYTVTLIPPVLSGQLGLTALHTDGRVLAFAVAISAASAGIAALIPAFGTWRTNPKEALSDGGRSATSGQGVRTLGLMVVAETAVTLVLIAGSGMIIQNFLRLRSQPLGFDSRGLATFELVPPASAYPAGEKRDLLVRRILEEARSVPGASAAATTVNPLGGGTWSSSVVTEDAQAKSPDTIITINFRLITPGLLETMGIPLLRGRPFTSQDRQGSSEVAIVSARMARRFWPDQDAIGKRLRVARPGMPWVTVVGVAGDVSDRQDPGGPLETWYRPYAQGAATPAAERIYLMVRTARDPLTVMPAVQAAVWRVDKTLAPYRVTAMDDYYAESIARERLGAVFMLAIGGFGLMLAALGVYGVMAFSVAQRTTEIGIRIALGGRPAHVLPLILKRALLQIGAGVALGIVTAMILSRVLASVMSDVGSLDRGMVAGASALIGVAALLACLVPALKALRLDPAAALKGD